MILNLSMDFQGARLLSTAVSLEDGTVSPPSWTQDVGGDHTEGEAHGY